VLDRIRGWFFKRDRQKHRASFERVKRAEKASHDQHVASQRAARVIAEMRRTEIALRDGNG
jgi:hypothetical protein